MVGVGSWAAGGHAAVTTDRGRPSYELGDLWTALETGEYVFRRTARDGFSALGWKEADACHCLRRLSRSGFQKSMLGRDIKGWHDVYKVEWKGHRVYVHFCRPTAEAPFVIAAFKQDTDFDY